MSIRIGKLVCYCPCMIFCLLKYFLWQKWEYACLMLTRIILSLDLSIAKALSPYKNHYQSGGKFNPFVEHITYVVGFSHLPTVLVSLSCPLTNCKVLSTTKSSVDVRLLADSCLQNSCPDILCNFLNLFNSVLFQPHFIWETMV